MVCGQVSIGPSVLFWEGGRDFGGTVGLPDAPSLYPSGQQQQLTRDAVGLPDLQASEEPLSVPRTGSVSPTPLTSSSPRSREFMDEAETQRWEMTHLMPPDSKPSVLSTPPGRLISLRCKLGGQEAPRSPGHTPTVCRQGPQLRAGLGTGDTYMITQKAVCMHGMYPAWDRPQLLILTVAPGGRCSVFPFHRQETGSER